ncbi:MAG: hypothetical protein D3924_01915 [Candidatus Electrothrix sp. AR4]|nr:hypothetical protein [Candidatus Electrothrix sp. AR4]
MKIQNTAHCINSLSLRLIGVTLLAFLNLIDVVYADDPEFTNDTMETKITAPPPNIMFVLDNSGSMDWSFMSPEPGGLFHNEYYLWNLSDNVDGSRYVLDNKLEWKSQWAGYNKMYYNQDVQYAPWPRWNKMDNTEGADNKKIKEGGKYPPFHADLKTPRSNPIFYSPTLNLHDEYFTLDGVQVNNAHYYTVDDKNNNGQLDLGEAVYLVNFVWTDINNDNKINNAEILRHYYRIRYNNDSGNHEDVIALETVSYKPVSQETDEVPDAIQPQTYDSSGTQTGFKSDIDDFQNFANWFSFYRRRELTAKAAISRTLVEMGEVNVGYNSMHRTNSDGGAKQEVLPVKVYQNTVSSTELIVDNRNSYNREADSGLSKTKGRWAESRNRPEYRSSSYYTSARNAWITFRPNIPEDGLYTVSAFWNCNETRDQNAKITVNHKSGEETAYYNQRGSDNDVVTTGDCTDNTAQSGCCGYWIDLGSYFFKEGTTGYVQIKRHSTSGKNGKSTGSSTVADAVRFSMQNVIDTGKVDRTNDLLDLLYRVKSNNNTPLRQALLEVGQYFDKNDTSDGTLGASPYFPEEAGGTCQQAYTVAMTDGFWNGKTNPGVGNSDGGKGAPYEDRHSNTLADVAMHYYDTDLASDLDNEVPANNYDKRKTQHMVTFGVSFGLEGTIDPDDMDGDGNIDSSSYEDDPYFLNSDTPHPTWPRPISDRPTTIDDLWHATVNGRGKFFSAKNPDSLVSALRDTFADIGSRTASGSSASVNGDELRTGLVLYQSTYVSGAWTGDVRAFPVDPNTGEIKKKDEEILWWANKKVQEQDWNAGRKIFTFDGDKGIPFRYKELSDAQKNALNNNPDTVDYLRGREITGFRKRTEESTPSAPLGDLVHSAPLLVSSISPETDGIDNDEDTEIDEEGEKGGTIFVGGNDGMLHALHAQTGAERFAYFPLRSFDYLYDLTKVDYQHRFYVDGRQSFKRMTFFAGNQTKDGKDNDGDGFTDEVDENYSDTIDNDGDGDIDESLEYKTITLLVGTLNKGGRGIYALDISNAEFISPDSNEDENFLLSDPEPKIKVMWEYPPVGKDGMEYVFSGNQRKDKIDNDGDGCTDGAPSPPLCKNEADNGDDENYSDGFDNDGDGTIDEEGETVLTNIQLLADSDKIDNNGDGEIDEKGELTNEPDHDIGYTYGDAFTVRSNKSNNLAYNEEGDHPWVVIFSNGYLSRNQDAVLYIVDALSGDLIRKIKTGAIGNNGLSSPAVIDVDNDARVDFAYAGDLLGNMWKFDLRDSNPEKWGVFHGKDVTNPDVNAPRIDYADTNGTDNDDPRPLINVGRAITTAPDVTLHCTAQGYLVAFGTGKFLGEEDLEDNAQQGIFTIWDFGENPKDYLGNWTNNVFTADTDSTLGINPEVKLLEQKEIDWRWYEAAGGGSFLRTLSNYTPQWYASCNDKKDNDINGTVDDEPCIPFSSTPYNTDGQDNDGDGAIDEPLPGDTDPAEPKEGTGHVGWFFDLPYHQGLDGRDNDKDGNIDEEDEQNTPAGERIVKDVIIRDGKLIAISMIPGKSPCDGGGDSIVHEMSICTGGRLDQPVFDINNDGKIDQNDLITITIKDPNDPTKTITVDVPPTGKMYDGILHNPVIVKDNQDKDEDNDKDRELKIFSGSSGSTDIMMERKEKTGFYYWVER